MHTNTPLEELPALFDELRTAAKTFDITPRTQEEAAIKTEAENRVILNVIDVAEVYLATQIRIANALERLASTVQGGD